MTTLAQKVPPHQPHPDAFAFVQELAAELSSGKVDLPSFPEIAVRVRQVLSDEGVSPDKVVRVVGSEPALAARLLQIANSAALNFSGRAVTELRTAVARMGFNMVRSAAIAFAMSQLKRVDALKGLEKPLEVLWNRSATVAALSHVVARRLDLGPLPWIPALRLSSRHADAGRAMIEQRPDRLAKTKALAKYLQMRRDIDMYRMIGPDGLHRSQSVGHEQVACIVVTPFRDRQKLVDHDLGLLLVTGQQACVGDNLRRSAVRFKSKYV